MRPLRRTLFPGAVVLGYHRVADEAWDPLGLAVATRHFAEHLEVLKDLRTIVSLEELLQRHARRESLEDYAVLTFDDGYQDFADTVAPMALAHEAPVTIFVATGCLGRQFWWEELVHLLAPGGPGGPVLEVSIAGSESMRFTGMEEAGVRFEAVNAIAPRLSRARSKVVESVLEQVRAWAGARPPVPEAARPMTPPTMAEVAGNPVVEVAAHTVSHCFLELLGEEDQRSEIARSKSDLEALCGREVRLFSYPNGSYSRATPRIVRETGFAGACASMEGIFSGRGDPYMIPRNWVPDIPGPAFRAWLGSWVREART
jgi:peptidoglycan/xylan/chitin deacetylase (PgdA/CDA1 family)